MLGTLTPTKTLSLCSLERFPLEYFLSLFCIKHTCICGLFTYTQDDRICAMRIPEMEAQAWRMPVIALENMFYVGTVPWIRPL